MSIAKPVAEGLKIVARTVAYSGMFGTNTAIHLKMDKKYYSDNKEKTTSSEIIHKTKKIAVSGGCFVVGDVLYTVAATGINAATKVSKFI